MPRFLPGIVFVMALGFSVAVHAASPAELTQLQQQHAFLFTERVILPHDRGLEALNTKFLAALANAGDEAKNAGNLPAVLAIEDEKKRIAGKQPPPERDEAATPDPLKKLRTIYRDQLKVLDQQRDSAQAVLSASYTTNLKELESTLTKASRLEEAKAVMDFRQSLGPEPAPAFPVAAGGGASVPGPVFTNSLGMKFVKVPGTKVLCCIHETRRQDYAAYAAKARGVDDSWKNRAEQGVPVGDKDDHPVAGVNWHDAQAFCVWLSKKEGKTYRLPTDKEWSFAAGVGPLEQWPQQPDPEAMKDKVMDHFPWEGVSPPQSGDNAGNYADTAFTNKFRGAAGIAGYDDGFVTTAPVMRFKPNKLGIYDLGGNVWEWCQDWYDKDHKQGLVLRGGSYTSHSNMNSSYRMRDGPHFRHNFVGFRVVLE